MGTTTFRIGAALLALVALVPFASAQQLDWVHKGGFHGPLEYEHVTLTPTAVGGNLTIERKSFGKPAQKPVVVPLSVEQVSQLWQALNSNDVMTLPTTRANRMVTDLDTLEVDVKAGGKANHFQVRGPMMMGEEKRYAKIYETVELLIRKLAPSDTKPDNAPLEGVTVLTVQSSGAGVPKAVGEGVTVPPAIDPSARPAAIPAGPPSVPQLGVTTR